jgi:regulator of RNase E activity RraA
VAVFPNDVLVLDDDGAVLIPQNLLTDIVKSAQAQEQLERWIMSEVEKGAVLPGLYPPNADNLARYKSAMKSRE